MKRLSVSVGTQTLRLWENQRLLKEWPCSTSKFGLGFVEGSLRTPVGHFTVKEKLGAEATWGTVFKSRQPVGIWKTGDETQDDLVLTRIFRLEGLEPRNANTFSRYIYIHGTNDERGIGKRGSHGCIRLKNDDVIELYDLVPEGTDLWIQE
ncbi:MAG: L,D-transpeptidase [Verrucomicrobiaceae bacterium]|nr:L,D-transpeptidase [Verrucomicrobiaceae bacterium]